MIQLEEDIERIRTRMEAGGHHARSVLRGTKEDWNKIRARIYLRDAGACHPCGLPIDPDHYECGHVIDRCCGGSDRDSNLVAMCIMCNRLKPIHTTRATYLDWADMVRDRGPVYASMVCP